MVHPTPIMTLDISHHIMDPVSRAGSEYSLESLTATAEKRALLNRKEEMSNRLRLYKLLWSKWGSRLAIIPSVILGCTPMTMFIIFAQVINALGEWMNDRTIDVLTEIRNYSLLFFGLSIMFGVCNFLNSCCWIRIGSQFTTEIRSNMFEHMMQTEVSFFDTTPIGTILTLLSEDAETVQDNFGSIKGFQLMQLGQFLAGIVTIYVFSWKIGLTATAYIPFVLLMIAAFSRLIDRHVIRKFQYVAKSMTIAEETLSAVRTVRGFNRERMETARFMKETRSAEGQELWIGAQVTTMFWIIMVSLWILIIGAMFWGGKMVLNGELPPGDLFSIFGFLLFGNFALIALQTSLQAEQKAIASGGRILDFTDRRSSIPFSGGDQIPDFKGHIEFRNVSFQYPSRESFVLRNVSFIIQPGQIGALVGHSGSGKSTCIQLLERFYDATEGVILLDGRDIRTLDPRWLHQKIALVAQEPTLFQMSISENVKYGKPEATDAEVESAIEIANAKRFISKMEKGLDTVVGEKGSTLSGGQRQRIAIARAVIRDPIILMTDEATSALDAASEQRVQSALDKVMERRTAVVVAHRLSTIRNAHVIYVFDAGEIKESGRHDELVAKKGWYYELVKRQLTEGDMQVADEPSQSRGGNRDESRKSKVAKTSHMETSDSETSDDGVPKTDFLVSESTS
jgi:ABC-type multidrug transport system fused ATPase/permease subunit